MIREAMEHVSLLRERTAGQPSLRAALAAVKQLQSRRFAGTYADLLHTEPYASAARFFLVELYGDNDYAARDQQFSRIAGMVETLFPRPVVGTAVALAELHALTEDLDTVMARAWDGLPAGIPVGLYVRAWQQVARDEDRRRQLQAVLALGGELGRLTRTRGLRTMLRMMRGPATAAGLGALQRFLESGFDTFADLARQPAALTTFVQVIEQRETELLLLLSGADLIASEARLAGILGQAR